MQNLDTTGELVTVRNGRFRIERRSDPRVRVPEVMLKCVGFIGEVTHRDGDKVDGDLCATGFFVSVPSVNLPGTYCYFVTAKHVATDLANSEVYFVVNKRGGGTTRMNGVGDAWHLHPTDKTADVAVTQMAMTPDADMIAVPLGDFVTPEDIRNQTIGIGDEVFATGLFTPVTGSRGLLPIVRHGNIAMIPNEQIQTELGFADVYLVEARSIGGLSGSPVWARGSLLSAFQSSQSGKPVPASLVGPGKLLGLMHGHWDVREAEMDNYHIAHSRRGVNLGIGIVVPAIKILETLHSLPLIASRNDEDRKVMKRSVPGMDSIKRKPKEEEQQAFTKEDFEAALKKASRRTSSKT
jgi:hypothetical protein